MSKLTSQERLDLKKMLRESDAQDNTEHIRNVKHSVKIRDDIRALDKLKKTCSPENLEQQGPLTAPFLLENYPDIYKKILQDELNLEIMSRLLTILKLIEDGKVDQHEASVLVGKLLKELYVDSALKKEKKLDDKFKESQSQDPNPEEPISISWSEYKEMRLKK